MGSYRFIQGHIGFQGLGAPITSTAGALRRRSNGKWHGQMYTVGKRRFLC